MIWWTHLIKCRTNKIPHFLAVFRLSRNDLFAGAWAQSSVNKALFRSRSTRSRINRTSNASSFGNSMESERTGRAHRRRLRTPDTCARRPYRTGSTARPERTDSSRRGTAQPPRSTCTCRIRALHVSWTRDVNWSSFLGALCFFSIQYSNSLWFMNQIASEFLAYSTLEFSIWKYNSVHIDWRD